MDQLLLLILLILKYISALSFACRPSAAATNRTDCLRVTAQGKKISGQGDSYRAAAPLTPHPSQDVRRTAGPSTHLTPRPWRQVALPPVVVKRILQPQKVDPEWEALVTFIDTNYYQILCISSHLALKTPVQVTNRYLGPVYYSKYQNMTLKRFTIYRRWQM